MVKAKGVEERGDERIEEILSDDDDDDDEGDDVRIEDSSDEEDEDKRKKKRRRISISSSSDEEEDKSGDDVMNIDNSSTSSTSSTSSSEEEESSSEEEEDEEVNKTPKHLQPVRCNPRHLNMFTGFLHEYDGDFEIDPEKIKPICNHLFNVWCNGNEELYDFLIGFYACIIRFPASHPAIAVVVHSEQGAGKGCITTFLREHVIGSKWASSCSEMEQLTGKFTAILLNKLYINCDEINNFGGGYKKNNRLKNLISEKTQSVEKKNYDPFDVDVYCRFTFLSNNKRVVKVESGCRRYFCLHAKNKERNKPRYFKHLHKFLGSKDVGKHFFHYLANWNQPWNHFKIPMTCYRQELMRKEIPSGPLFLFDQLVENKIAEHVISLNDLYNIYENEWCPIHLEINLEKTFKKMKKIEFHEFIVGVFKFHSVLNPNDDHDHDIWFETEMDFSGSSATQTYSYNMPSEQHDAMIERFRVTYGFFVPIDLEDEV